MASAGSRAAFTSWGFLGFSLNAFVCPAAVPGLGAGQGLSPAVMGSFLSGPSTHQEGQKPSTVQPPAWSHCRFSCCQSLWSTAESRAGCAPLPLGGSQQNRLGQQWPQADPARICLTCQALLCLPSCWRWYPRRNPLWKSSRAPFSSAVSLGICLSLALPPAPSPLCPFQTGDLLPLSRFSEANSNSFCASLRCLSSLCAQPAQEMKQDYYHHTLYPEYVYKMLINY